ncbi:hypothetical protein GGR57DRAFT_106318 [Xylariaceae sp. FL1272]|nr:hypothetical protein GGR57DRAFT_106318 [Xylariaceae sp. FL1272]
MNSSSSSAMSQQQMLLKLLINFYDQGIKGKDARGRTFQEILTKWSDDQLEMHHDYIQWVFPLTESSAYQSGAPVLDEETLLQFRTSAHLQYQVLLMLQRLLQFYGFSSHLQYDEKNAEKPFHLAITATEGSPEPYRSWLSARTHNHQRITRMIRCLRLVHLNGIAVEVCNAFVHVNALFDRVQKTSVEFWQRAASLPLEETPDGHVIEWLAKYNV